MAGSGFGGRLTLCVAVAGVMLAPARAARAQNIAAQPAPQDGRAQAIGCMTAAILYEAAFEPAPGQEAVAEVILNRLRNPAYPKTICGVVFQGSHRRTGCQFSFTCDGSLRRGLPVAAMAQARDVATRAVDGQLTSRVAGATHYHADYVSPYWAPSLVRIGAIGRHIFYRQPGASGLSAIARYAAIGEQLPAALAAGPFLAGASSTAAVAAGAEPVKPEPFLPWGLATGAPDQPTGGGE